LRGFGRGPAAFSRIVTFNGRAFDVPLLGIPVPAQPRALPVGLRAHLTAAPRAAPVEAAPGVLAACNRWRSRCSACAGTATCRERRSRSIWFELPAPPRRPRAGEGPGAQPARRVSLAALSGPRVPVGGGRVGGGSARPSIPLAAPGAGGAARRCEAQYPGWRRSTTTRCQVRWLLPWPPGKRGGDHAAAGQLWELGGGGGRLGGPCGSWRSTRASRPRPRGGPGRRAAGARAARGGRVAHRPSRASPPTSAADKPRPAGCRPTRPATAASLIITDITVGAG